VAALADKARTLLVILLLVKVWVAAIPAKVSVASGRVIVLGVETLAVIVTLFVAGVEEEPEIYNVCQGREVEPKFNPVAPGIKEVLTAGEERLESDTLAPELAAAPQEGVALVVAVRTCPVVPLGKRASLPSVPR
jgi:hypothetical protein